MFYLPRIVAHQAQGISDERTSLQPGDLIVWDQTSVKSGLGHVRVLRNFVIDGEPTGFELYWPDQRRRSSACVQTDMPRVVRALLQEAHAEVDCRLRAEEVGFERRDGVVVSVSYRVLED